MGTYDTKLFYSINRKAGTNVKQSQVAHSLLYTIFIGLPILSELSPVTDNSNPRKYIWKYYICENQT